MKVALSAVLLAAGLTLGAIADAQAVTNKYRVAHVRHQGSNMVIVIINPSFFYGSRQDQQRWFTGIQQCVRSVNLAEPDADRHQRQWPLPVLWPQ